MSNPGVVLLASGTVGGQSFRIEDNIGEAIHIHWGNIRIDLSIKEFFDLAISCKDIIEKMINIDNFSFDLFDAIFLTQNCSSMINLDKLVFEDINVSDLLTDQYDDKGHRSYININESRVSKAIQGDLSIVNSWKQVNYFGDDNISRVNTIYNSIREHGYHPKSKGTYVVLHGPTNIVIDGCHRSSCVLNVYGNINIPIIRWYKKNESQNPEILENDIITNYNNYVDEINEKIRMRINRKKKFTKYLLEKDLYGKRILLKGAGLHSEELLKILDKNTVDIVGVQDNNIKQNCWNGFPVIKKEDISSKYIDVILISSYLYQKEMIEEMKCYRDIEIYNIYENGIDEEFFST